MIAVAGHPAVAGQVGRAVRGMPAAVPRSTAEQRGEQHHRGAQVVLDRVGKKDGPEKQSGECKPVSKPVRIASNLRFADHLDEAADDGDDRDRTQHEGGDQDGVEKNAPDKLPPVCGARTLRLWRRVLHHQSPILSASSEVAKRRWPPGVTTAARTLPLRTARFSVGWLMPNMRAAAFELTSSVRASTSASLSRNRRCPPGVTTAGLSNPLATARRTVARLTPRRVAKSFELIKVCKSCGGATHF